MIYFLSDLHFGVRNASVEWLKIQLDFFEFFLKQVKSKQNTLIIAGDVFDNRQTLNILVFHSVLNLFKGLSKEFESIHIIVGNHDISNKTTNDVNALSVFDLIPNIHVYQEPTQVEINGKSFVMMPWMNHQEHIELQKFTDADYCVMHTDINSLHFNKYAKINDGVELINLKQFKYVFNGHIHFRQEKDNIIMLGSPYHMNRNDLDNDKYIYYLDCDKLNRFKNTFSPEFKQLDFYNLMEMTVAEAREWFTNNYIYLNISNNVSFDSSINAILDELNVARNVKILYYDESEYDAVDIEYNDNFSIDDVISEYINSLKQDDDTKQNVASIIDNYKKISTL